MQDFVDDRFEIVGRLGAGGHGTVFKARHRLLDEHYALKLIAPDLDDTPAFIDRLRNEARTMAKLRHANIVRVHDLITRDGRPYCLVLDYVDGPTLAGYIERHGPLSGDAALEVAGQLASALEHAHGLGVWHRDVKPRNVLIESACPWRVLLTDFGIAKRQGDDLTETGLILGSTRYCAPEQVGYRGRPDEPFRMKVDQRTDVFALGLVLFEMLKGEQFFAGMDLSDVVAWAHHPEQRRISLGANVGPEIRRLLVRALSRDPDGRQQTMSEMLRDIERCRAAPLARATPPTDDDADVTETVACLVRPTDVVRASRSGERGASDSRFAPGAGKGGAAKRLGFCSIVMASGAVALVGLAILMSRSRPIGPKLEEAGATLAQTVAVHSRASAAIDEAPGSAAEQTDEPAAPPKNPFDTLPDGVQSSTPRDPLQDQDFVGSASAADSPRSVSPKRAPRPRSVARHPGALLRPPPRPRAAVVSPRKRIQRTPGGGRSPRGSSDGAAASAPAADGLGAVVSDDPPAAANTGKWQVHK